MFCEHDWTAVEQDSFAVIFILHSLLQLSTSQSRFYEHLYVTNFSTFNQQNLDLRAQYNLVTNGLATRYIFGIRR